jgi:type I restriction enzyme S subunit
MKCKLEDIVDVTMGQSPKSEYYNTEGKGYPFLQGNRTFGFKYPTFDTYTTVMTKPAKAGDVIMSVRAPVGDLNITPVDMCLGRGVCSLRMKNGNQDFLFYMMKYYIPHLLKKESGTVFGSVNRNDINGLEVNIPEDAQVQKEIARYLEMIDDKIELNNAINNNLEQQAEAIFQSILSNAITTVNLGEIADVKGGKRLPKGVNLTDIPNAHPYIRVRDLNNALFASLTPNYAYVDKETQKSISRYIVSTGDVLISIVGTIGLTAIVDSTLDKANLTENCVKVTNLKHITPEYLLLYLRSQLGREAIAKGTVGAVQQKLPIKNIQAIPIPLLSEKDKNALFCTLDSIFAGISNNVIQSAKLASLRDTLLPRLMSSELDVSDINL